MATITINVEDPEEASYACREVASLIESGFFVELSDVLEILGNLTNNFVSPNFLHL